jgi:tetratricopeptide (TPR) repeat protein
MPPKYAIISVLAVLLSFVGGFLLANALNRSDMETVSAENERLKAAIAEQEKNKERSTLSDDEIRARLAEADQNPGKLDLQRGLGIALYQYAASERNTALIADAIRVLERANSLDPNDRDVIIALAHAHFDIGYFDKKNEHLLIARDFYTKALTREPDDANVRVDQGLTFFLHDPPDYASAIDHFERALKTDPKQERALQFLIQSYWRQNRSQKAAEYLETLKSVNPGNAAIPELSSMLTQPAAAQ